MHTSDYRGKIPFLNLHLHILIDDPFYGLWRHMAEWKFAFNFEFSLDCLYTSVKGKFFNNGISISSGQLKRFNQSVIDPKCYWKLRWGPFFITIYSFQAILYFLLCYYFYLRNTVYMLSKWLGILINTKFFKVLRFSVFI